MVANVEAAWSECSSVVWKYALGGVGVVAARDPRRAVMLPRGAEVVLVGKQGPQWVIWFRVDPIAVEEQRAFQVVGTGQEVPPGASHCGSFQDGSFVWHVFEVPAP